MATKARNVWTTKQEQRLRELCGTMSLEDVAEELGVSYHAAKNKVQKLKISARYESDNRGYFVFYRGDEHLITGTKKECALLLGVKESTIQWYLTPSNQKRVALKDPNTVLTAFRLNI